MKPALTLTDSEQGLVAELLTTLEIEEQRTLEMLREAIETGETKSDNVNIAEAKRTLDYLRALLKKIKTGKGDLELTAVEAGQLDKLFSDAQNLRDCWESECAKELEEAQEQGLGDCKLGEEARRYKELDDILDTLRPLSKRLDEDKFEWPKQCE